MKTKIKLIKVMAGLYRTESGGIRVSHFPWKKNSSGGNTWFVYWTDFMSARHEKGFSSLKEVREYLNNGY